MSDNISSVAEPAKESTPKIRRDPLAAPIRVLHPALLALQPVLGLYANNAGKTALSDLVRPSLVLVGCAIGLWAVFRLLMRDKHRAGVAASVVTVAALTGWNLLEYVIRMAASAAPSLPLIGFTVVYGVACLIFLAVYLRLFSGQPGIFRNAIILAVVASGLAVVADTLLAPAYGPAPAALITVYLTGALFGLALLFRYQAAYEPWTQTLNWFAGVLLGLYLLLAVGNLWRLPPEPKSAGTVPASSSTVTADTATCPDIYFIALEGYAGADVLQRTYGYDAAPFLEAMKAKGFQVAPDSRSNYALTLFSLASCLNMDYLQDVLGGPGPKPDPYAKVLTAYHRNKVYDFLKSRGYSLQVLAPGSEALEPKSNVDVQFRPLRSLTEFERVLAKSTVAGRVWQLAHHVRDDTTATLNADFIRERVGFAFDRLNSLAQQSGDKPRFIFANLPIPGGQIFAFDRDGQAPASLRTSYSLSGEFNGSAAEFKRAYVEQMAYLDTRLEQTTGQILRGAKRPVVILVVSGNGPWFEAAVPTDRLPVTDRFANLILAYLPPEFGGQQPLFGAGATLVNVFPALFNRVFGTTLPLRPDTVFISKPAQPLDFSPLPWAPR